jgi:hypothetical protein
MLDCDWSSDVCSSDLSTIKMVAMHAQIGGVLGTAVERW